MDNLWISGVIIDISASRIRVYIVLVLSSSENIGNAKCMSIKYLQQYTIQITALRLRKER